MVATLAALAASALAAEPQKAPAPVPADPAATTATFGDWVLNCQRLPDGSKQSQVCEVVQSIQVQGQQVPFARIAIGRIAPNQPLAVTVVLPNNISLPSVVHVGADAKDKGPDLNWTRCTPGGCFAESPLTAETLTQWRAPGPASRVSFEDAAGREIGFPISFRGLPQALDALAKEF
jgi:invasion protein IalB